MTNKTIKIETITDFEEVAKQAHGLAQEIVNRFNNTALVNAEGYRPHGNSPRYGRLTSYDTQALKECAARLHKLTVALYKDMED